MDISKAEQRVLHLLAQGGRVLVEKDARNRIIHATCVTREGWHSPGLDLALFKKLRRRRYIASKNGGPYRVTRLGLRRVRAQPDNR
ncbi:YjhX family toxin [Stappia stellulata]|uniref:YjhX family toxin n=1 Tax=Stappia stellulata TaxID=71235 RepID=UPI001CD2FC2F|nr:YjhX family toxin [Stappia stellulata]MCA1241437.1 YjhX family toxin [Stappia stellulata]